MSDVKLAIRVRPFSERELKSESDRTRVVNVIDDHYVTITNIKVSLSGAGDSRERVRRYHADYTFDSACSVNQPTYATQQKVFEKLGRGVLTSISQGNSTCVLAYGQSSTGKTHTMMGSDSQPGLIPRICRALAEELPCDMSVSFLEIYNERVHDLLVSDTNNLTCHSLPRRRGNSRKDLRVREHPTKGPYVQNLRRVAVNNVEALLALVCEGTRRRRTAATRRNTTSSRSHALLEITTSRAVLHLADLAGSEKAGWEGCGGRQKEGANINKSLVALSNVISALVNVGSGRGKFVPYRDSALTWLLKDSFTAGANTFIIATVSPSFACYGESASTLRWAARARQLRTTKPSCGISPTSRAVLQAQYDQLIAELGRNFIQYIPETGKIFFGDEHWVLYSSKVENKNKVQLDIDICKNMNPPQIKVDQTSESTASSAASGSSDIVNTIDNTKITDAVDEEIDKILGSALERTSSGSNLKVIAPLRHKRRQYRSQEVLHPNDGISSSQRQLSIASPSLSEILSNVDKSDKSKTPHVTIFHENQRAEIIASVTERLYSKLKKKEEAAVSKIESVIDRKITEPLSELRICTNARQRLMELSQKAIRNKRKIGIPAYTQTRISVIRVKDQATDVQTDLGSYIMENRRMYSFYRDVGTETIPLTLRCKEIAVGSNYDSVNFIEISKGTQTRQVSCKNCVVMTDNPVKRCQYTQTQLLPPPRRKKRSPLVPNTLTCNRENSSTDSVFAPVISINISQTYSIDSETLSSDENIQNNIKIIDHRNLISTPDLLTNHSISDVKVEDESIQEIIADQKDVAEGISNYDNQQQQQINENNVQKVSDEFIDQEECELPRVTRNSLMPASNYEMKNIILGRNKNMYPYNIEISPLKEKKNIKRIVKFKDLDNDYNITSESSWDSDDCISKFVPILTPCEMKESERKFLETLGSIYSESSDSSQLEMDSFVRRKGTYAKTMDYPRNNNVPIYKNNPRHHTASTKYYKQYHKGKSEYDNADETYNTDDNQPKFTSSNEINITDNSQSIKNHVFEIKTGMYTHKDPNYDIDFDTCEKKLNACCNDLEQSTQRYGNYLLNYRNNKSKKIEKKPKEFLKELVKLRREVINSSGDTSDFCQRDTTSN